MLKNYFYRKILIKVLTAISCANKVQLPVYLGLFKKRIALLVNESMPLDCKILLKTQKETQNLNKKDENS